MIKKKWFTLLELTLVVIISGSLLTTIYGIMTTLPKVKNFNDARQTLIQGTNDVMDRFAMLFQDYTIDYEEYFNRKMVGCNENKKGASFEWSVNANGHCEAFSAYGNHNAKLQTIGENESHHILYCSSDAKNGEYTLLVPLENCKNNDGQFPQGKTSYGQYEQLFRDVRNDTDGLMIWRKPHEVWDSDDRDLGEGPAAIGDPEKIQELYLISHDGQRRLFLRKILKNYKDLKGEASTGYTLQILKLRGFDAGREHKFDAENDTEVYDWQIDTRACDYGQQFICGWNQIPNYLGYKMPANKDDGWVDLFDENLNITDWKIQISPQKNPDYAWAESDQQINPFIKISLTTKLTDHLRANKLGGNTSGYQYTLQNTYDTKGFYLQ